MSGFSGSALVVQWIQSAATTVLTGDQRNFNITPSIDYVDETAGADVHKQRLPGVKDSSASFEAVLQSGTGAGGTASYNLLTEGGYGTVIWSPEGTAGGKSKYTWPAYSGGAAFQYPYSDVVIVTVNFQGNGTVVPGTN